MRKLRVRPTRLIHDGGHDMYNAYVAGRMRACIRGKSAADASEALSKLQSDLRRRISMDDSSLPWQR
jgi:hypothetical protein